jgi:hypothetical protein
VVAVLQVSCQVYFIDEWSIVYVTSNTFYSFIDAFAPSPSESRSSSAATVNRSAAAATTTATPAVTVGTAPVIRPGDSSSKPRNEGASASAIGTVPIASGNRSAQIQMSALTNILANLSGSSASQTMDDETSGTGKPAIDLYDIMNTEVNSFVCTHKNDLILLFIDFTSQNLVPILSNKDVQEKLRAHLPDGIVMFNTEKDLRDSIQSPQFRQAVGTFR